MKAKTAECRTNGFDLLPHLATAGRSWFSSVQEEHTTEGEDRLAGIIQFVFKLGYWIGYGEGLDEGAEPYEQEAVEALKGK